MFLSNRITFVRSEELTLAGSSGLRLLTSDLDGSSAFPKVEELHLNDSLLSPEQVGSQLFGS